MSCGGWPWLQRYYSCSPRLAPAGGCCRVDGSAASPRLKWCLMWAGSCQPQSLLILQSAAAVLLSEGAALALVAAARGGAQALALPRRRACALQGMHEAAQMGGCAPANHPATHIWPATWEAAFFGSSMMATNASAGYAGRRERG